MHLLCTVNTGLPADCVDIVDKTNRSHPLRCLYSLLFPFEYFKLRWGQYPMAAARLSSVL